MSNQQSEEGNQWWNERMLERVLLRRIGEDRVEGSRWGSWFLCLCLSFLFLNLDFSHGRKRKNNKRVDQH